MAQGKEQSEWTRHKAQHAREFTSISVLRSPILIMIYQIGMLNSEQQPFHP